MAGVKAGLKAYLYELEQQLSFYRNYFLAMDRFAHKEPLGDNDPMPFGEHQGTLMKDMPPEYLLWLFRQDWIKRWEGVYAYLSKNQDLLLSELPDTKDEDDPGGFDSFADYERYGR